MLLKPMIERRFTLATFALMCLGVSSIALANTGAQGQLKQKFEITDCVLNKDPQSSWYRQEAEVFDITESKKYGATIYVLYFPDSTRRPGQDKYGFFHMPSVDRMSTLVKKGGCT